MTQKYVLNEGNDLILMGIKIDLDKIDCIPSPILRSIVKRIGEKSNHPLSLYKEYDKSKYSEEERYDEYHEVYRDYDRYDHEWRPCWRP